MVLEIGLVALWMVILPFTVGILTLPSKVCSIEGTDIFVCYIRGILLEFALFALITVPITFLNGTLTHVMMFWLVGNLVLGLAAAAYQYYMRSNKKRICWNKKRKISLLGWCSILLIAFQIIFVTINVHIDNDDAWYVGTAVASYATDTINKIHPYTGEMMVGFPKDYTLSPYPIFFAMVGKLTFVHPAILMHTIMPVILISISYMVYYLLVNMLCYKQKQQVEKMMFFIALFNLFGNYSVRAASTFLLFRIWQGKATLCNIVVPAIIYFFMQCVEEEKNGRWGDLLLSVIAGTMVSSMGVFLLPVLLTVMSFIVLVRYKKIKQVVYTFVCIIPCIIQFGIYILVLR